MEDDQFDLDNFGLVNISGDGRKFILEDVVFDPTFVGGGTTQLAVKRFPKRRDFLHEIPDSATENENFTKRQWLDADDCVISNLPVDYSIFTAFIPSIIHKFEECMIADTLRNTILEPLAFEDAHLPLLLQAITSSDTGDQANYQRLEFLGDCILKLISSVHLMAAHLKWPESLLTGKKGRLVSNGALSRATLQLGLDKFILTKRFTGAKWSPQYASFYLDYIGM